MTSGDQDLLFEPCPHCGCSHVKVVNWNGTSLTAAQCRACGARGPVRPIMADNDIEAVHALVADDWNIRFPLGETQAILDRLDAEEAATQKFCESPATDLAAMPGQNGEDDAAQQIERAGSAQVPEPSAVEGGEGAAKNTPASPHVGQCTGAEDASGTKTAKPSDDGSGLAPNISPTPDPSAAPAASQPVDPKGDDRKSSNGGGDGEIDAAALGARLKNYLVRIKAPSPQSAIKSGHDLGVSWCTAQKVMDGKKVSAWSLETLQLALDALEARLEYGVPIEKLPNSLPPIKRLNPLPTYTPPARCSRET